MKLPVQMAGFDWKQVFAAIPAQATARAWQVALTPIAGSTPAVTDNGSYWTVSFTPEQEERVAAWVLTQLRKEPGPVRIDGGGIALRVVVKQYWPYALGLMALGAAAAYALRKG